MKTNIAFKLNYCNGQLAQDKLHFGFRAICTPGVIEYNITKKKADWCSHPLCPCAQFYSGQISYQELERIAREDNGVCMESRLLSEWTAYAEYSHDREDIEKFIPRPVRSTRPGSLAVLTTVKPNMDEANRKIFAVFLIDEVFEGDEIECGYVTAHPQYRLELSLKDANELSFWDFYKNQNSDKPKWGQGVFRYLFDSQAEKILQKICSIKSGTPDGILAEEMLQQFRRTHP